MQALVVANEESRRTANFIKAGKRAGVETRFITYDELEKHLTNYQNTLIKLEPPLYHESGFTAHQTLCKAYIARLEHIARLEKKQTVRFLNDPQAIIHALDKAKSKEQLAGLRLTPLISSSVETFDSLINLLTKEKCYNVFVKPRFGAGAGGIMALRYNEPKGQLVAYTTLARNHSLIYNTKRINRLTNPKEIALLANTVLKTDALVEKWLPKDTINGENYDLRVVCLANRVEHIAVRCSKGAITNLHLNNKALPYPSLGLPLSLTKEIEALSTQATALSSLHYAGIDILIEKDTLLPHIIEVNGQGDHIHQDIHNKNSIYRKQLTNAPAGGR